MSKKGSQWKLAKEGEHKVQHLTEEKGVSSYSKHSIHLVGLLDSQLLLKLVSPS